MNTHFYKMQGCGNDFLFLDCISDDITLRPDQIRYFCDRHFGIGADGLVILRKGETSDARWNFFNSDGSEAEMCGNAARCAIQYLSDRYFPGDDVISLETKAGVIKGRKLSNEYVEVTLTGQKDFKVEYEETILEVESGVLQLYLINTGVPHAVIEVKDLNTYPITKVGRDVQKHAMFQQHGTNVTFYQRTVGKKIRSTTFERGVEAETMACGTGAAAAALIFCETFLEQLPIEVSVPGGELVVDLSPVSQMLLLRGPARYVFETDFAEVPQGFEKAFLYEEAKRKKV